MNRRLNKAHKKGKIKLSIKSRINRLYEDETAKALDFWASQDSQLQCGKIDSEFLNGLKLYGKYLEENR